MRHLRYSLMGIGLTGILSIAGCDRNEWNLPKTRPPDASQAPANITGKERPQAEAPRDGAAGRDASAPVLKEKHGEKVRE